MATSTDADLFRRVAANFMNPGSMPSSPTVANNAPRSIKVSEAPSSPALVNQSAPINTAKTNNLSTVTASYSSKPHGPSSANSSEGAASPTVTQTARAPPPPQSVEQNGPQLHKSGMTAQERAELLSFVSNSGGGRRGPPPRSPNPSFRAESPTFCPVNTTTRSGQSAGQLLKDLKRPSSATPPSAWLNFDPAIKQKTPSSPLSSQSASSENIKANTTSSASAMPLNPQSSIQATLAKPTTPAVRPSQNPQASITASLLKSNQLGSNPITVKTPTAPATASKLVGTQVPVTTTAPAATTATATKATASDGLQAPLKPSVQSQTSAPTSAVPVAKLTPAPASTNKVSNSIPSSTTKTSGTGSDNESLKVLQAASQSNSAGSIPVKKESSVIESGHPLSTTTTTIPTGVPSDHESLRVLQTATQAKPSVVTINAQVPVKVTAANKSSAASASVDGKASAPPSINGDTKNKEMTITNGDVKSEEKSSINGGAVKAEEKVSIADLVARIQKLEAANNSLGAAVAMLEEEAERRKFLGTASAKQPFMLKVNTGGKDVLVQATKQLTVGELIRRLYVKLGINGYTVKNPRISFEAKALGHLKSLGELGICEDSLVVFSYEEE